MIDCLEGDLPVLSRKQWRPEDHYGLTAVALLELSALSGDLTEEIDSLAYTAMVEDQVDGFREALPFTRSELGLIADSYNPDLLPEDQRDEIQGLIPPQKLCVEGIFRATSGRDMMQRWWTWRRQTGDYEQDDSSLGLARTRIGRIYDSLVEGAELSRR